MQIELLMLGVSLAIILLSCELFTNGIEWFGKKLNMGEGVVGSILSAVGTCLPETMIPVIAIIFSTTEKNNVDVGIGAIVGAPFMLSTLAFFISGVSVLAFWKRRKTGLKMHINNKILSRDIGFFIIVYSVGICSKFISQSYLRTLVALLLLGCYIYYIILTLKSDSGSHGELEPLYTAKILKTRINMFTIMFQVILALSGIVLGAHIFVNHLNNISGMMGISALVLSLIIAPIATELPEKFNSVIWISKKKDTLALGNITGAMVFQSCIPVAIGILTTQWDLDLKAMVSAGLSIASSLLTYTWIKLKGKLNPIPLLMGGIFYAAFIVYLAMTGFQ